jgi:hypothetical protein
MFQVWLMCKIFSLKQHVTRLSGVGKPRFYPIFPPAAGANTHSVPAASRRSARIYRPGKSSCSPPGFIHSSHHSRAWAQLKPGATSPPGCGRAGPRAYPGGRSQDNAPVCKAIVSGDRGVSENSLAHAEHDVCALPTRPAPAIRRRCRYGGDANRRRVRLLRESSKGDGR